MVRTAKALFCMTAMGLALGGCGGVGFDGRGPPVDPNLYPANYRKEIVDLLSTTLQDPTNLRDTQISDPALTPVGRDNRYIACVRFSERDANKQYTNVDTRVAYFFEGKLNQLVISKPEQCTTAVYKPFPELENLCRGASCK